MRRLLLILALIASPAFAQVRIYNSGGVYVEIPSSTTLPGTCTVGELYIDTDADTDGSLYICRATDTWKEVDDDGGAGGSSFGIITDGVTPATADAGNDTITLTDSTTINFVTTNDPEDITASVIAESIPIADLSDVSGVTGTGSTVVLSAAPVLTGNATAATASVDDNDTSIATTAFVQAETVAAGDVTGTIGGGLTIGAGVVEETMMSTEDFGDFSCGAGLDDCLLDSGAVDSTAILDDGVNTADLDDGADTPAEGEVVAVAAATSDIAYVKPPPVTKTLFDTGGIVATDDIPDIHIWTEAAIVSAAQCIVTGGTSVTITLEDDAGNDLTTSCVCATTLTNCTLTGFTAFTADERLDFVVDSISGTNTSLTFVVEWNYDL